ncbi:uncharacterized protein LTR77_004473 [Saxophila tyrrhenica]|uniref:Putative lipoate-protein ligase A n=1 Tax=Saxophila tyrrhenica TaxID=1690608 RepID=A0AAV9PD12_9PEZI|nr:hypothetical protein LTR77_004473 [Saxophila tyrrhenica]
MHQLTPIPHQVPSIIIGRNQNPWLEVDLNLISQASKPGVLQQIDLVRRRSGGGTVFHDEGNVNWTVIYPSADFTRDKHAEMIVRALRGCGVERARVNERHDIVLDQGDRKADSDPKDTHTSPYTASSDSAARPLKVSGSAYKLTRGRALHHGTCLLSSPNLKFISQCLHSPARPYIKARGVESVSSPVTNIALSNEHFISAVQDQFSKMYDHDRGVEAMPFNDELLEVTEIKRGYEELQSLEWTYLQTPQFTLANSNEVSRPVNIDLTVRHGVVTDASIAPTASDPSLQERTSLNENLVGLTLHKVTNWQDELSDSLKALPSEEGRRFVVDWLSKMLPSIPRSGK